MVLLRRELDGIHLDRAIPVPSYALAESLSSLVLPTLDRLLLDRCGERVLLAGALRLPLAITLAEGGHFVTICDLEPGQERAVHARLPVSAAGHITLLDKVYGQAGFAPSSFDTIVLYDRLHAYDRPAWLTHKIARELKVDGLLVARLLVRGRLPGAAQPAADGDDLPVRIGRVGVEALVRASRTRLAWLLLAEEAREAIDRGAHLASARFAAPLEATVAAVGEHLHFEELLPGHSARLALIEGAWGARRAVAALMLRAADALPELAEGADAGRDAVRAVGLLARRGIGRGPAPAWGRHRPATARQEPRPA
jgi:hypothetical protein